jgi:hypothetical protein
VREHIFFTTSLWENDRDETFGAKSCDESLDNETEPKMTDQCDRANKMSMLFAMAMLTLKDYECLLTVNRKLISNADGPNVASLGLSGEEADFVANQRREGQFVLSCLVISCIWDHVKAIVTKALTYVVMLKPNICLKLPPKLKRVRAASDEVQRNKGSAEAIFALEESIDRAKVEGLEGLDAVEALLAQFGIAPMTPHEEKLLAEEWETLMVLPRMRNSLVHSMGRMKSKLYPQIVRENLSQAILHLWGANEQVASRAIEAAVRYLGVLCNRIARTIGASEPAKVPFDKV